MSRIDLHAGPAVGFDQPFDMLEACHERVQRSLGLLQRLQAHVAEQGVDVQAREAAGDVLRYFDKAGPAHHEDEERHVLPRLRELGQAALAERLHADHRAMEAQWRSLREVLAAIAAGQALQLDAEACARYAALYAAHIEAEEGQAYPPLRALSTPAQCQAMGEEMAQRRRM